MSNGEEATYNKRLASYHQHPATILNYQ